MAVTPFFDFDGSVRRLVLEAFALDALALQLAGTANSFSFFARTAFGGLLIRPTEFHFTEDAFTLHLLFEHF